MSLYIFTDGQLRIPHLWPGNLSTIRFYTFLRGNNRRKRRFYPFGGFANFQLRKEVIANSVLAGGFDNLDRSDGDRSIILIQPRSFQFVINGPLAREMQTCMATITPTSP